MALFLVETVSFFRHRYVVDADEADSAADTVVLGIGELTELKELSQKHIDECVSSVREIDEEEYLSIFDEDNELLEDLQTVRKLALINRRSNDES